MLGAAPASNILMSLTGAATLPLRHGLHSALPYDMAVSANSARTSPLLTRRNFSEIELSLSNAPTGM